MIYVIADCVTADTVYRVDGDCLEEVFTLEEPESDEFLTITDLQAQSGTLYAMTDTGIAAWNGSNVEYLPLDYWLDGISMLRNLPSAAAFILEIGVLITFILWLIFLRKGLLVKQLMLMIPTIAVIMGAIFLTALNCIMQAYFEKTSDEMIAAADLCAEQLDGDTLAEMTQTGDYAALYRTYREKLLQFADYNRGTWNGSFVDKYIGDAVMALFESADAAVEAGMELYRAIVLDPETAKRLHVSEINIGVGIHTGMARIGIVGEHERLSGTVISDTVNLSSRLESLTKTYHTAMLLSKDTLDKMEHPEKIGMRYLGLVQVAGVNEVKSLYEVLDCLDDQSKAERTANCADFREAVRLFHMGRRQEAADLLEQLMKNGKADHVVRMYLDYIRSMSGDDKGNVFRFVRK